MPRPIVNFEFKLTCVRNTASCKYLCLPSPGVNLSDGVAP